MDFTLSSVWQSGLALFGGVLVALIIWLVSQLLVDAIILSFLSKRMSLPKDGLIRGFWAAFLVKAFLGFFQIVAVIGQQIALAYGVHLYIVLAAAIIGVLLLIVGIFMAVYGIGPGTAFKLFAKYITLQTIVAGILMVIIIFLFSSLGLMSNTLTTTPAPQP